MAELTKKLHFKKSGTEETAKAYSTASEAGSSYIRVTIDGVAAYVPIGTTSDNLITKGRVIKGGTTYAIKSQSKPAYTEKSWTTAGTYTFTVPIGVTRIRVAVCGGGGGAISKEGTSGSGGTSSLKNSSGTVLLQATGGGGCRCFRANYSDGSSASVCTAGSAGSPNGRAGTSVDGYGESRYGTFAGGAGFALSFTLTNGAYGKGGDAYCDRNCSVGTGGSGGYNTSYVNVTPNTTYTIVVGSGGSGLQASSKSYAQAGNPGFVFIAYGGDI